MSQEVVPPDSDVAWNLHDPEDCWCNMLQSWAWIELLIPKNRPDQIFGFFSPNHGQWFDSIFDLMGLPVPGEPGFRVVGLQWEACHMHLGTVGRCLTVDPLQYAHARKSGAMTRFTLKSRAAIPKDSIAVPPKKTGDLLATKERQIGRETEGEKDGERETERERERE